MTYLKSLKQIGAAGALSLALALGLAGGTALAETKDAPAEARLTPVHIALLYHQISGEPAPVTNMMAKPVNKRFENEFERRRFAKDVFPAFKEFADDVLEQPAYYARFSVRLGDYDFEEERFPLNGIYSGSMFFHYSAGKAGSEGMDYAVRIGNTDEIKFLDMPMDEAEALLNRVQGKVSAEMWMVPVTPVKAGWREMKDEFYRTVEMQATVLKLFDGDGELIAEVKSATPDATNKAKAVKDNPISEPTFSNPWTAEDAPAAILDASKWYIDEKYKMGPGGGDAFEAAMNYSGAVSKGCIASFGFSDCQRLATARQRMIDRCAASVEESRKRECYKLRNLPYTTEEADSYSNRSSD